MEQWWFIFLQEEKRLKVLYKGHGTAVTTTRGQKDIEREMGDAAQERSSAVQPAADIEEGKV